MPPIHPFTGEAGPLKSKGILAGLRRGTVAARIGGGSAIISDARVYLLLGSGVGNAVVVAVVRRETL